MKKKIIIVSVLVFILAAVGTVLYLNKKNTKKVFKKTKIEKITEMPAKLDELSGINYELNQMSGYIVDYLKTKSSYKKIYKKKKFIVYIDGNNSPYSKEFKNTIDKIKQDKNFQKDYNFISRPPKAEFTIITTRDIKRMKAKKIKFPKNYLTTRDGNAELKFIKNCHSLCIVNPKNDQLFSIKGSTDKEAKKLEYIFDNLRKW